MSELNPEALEESLAGLEQVDEFSAGTINYDKYIVLPKKELVVFCKLTEPLTKSSTDEYGKSIFVHCLNEESVELCYHNSPFYLSIVVPNKSGKTIKDFSIHISSLKKLVSCAFASLILVEQDDEISISLCESLLFLDTKPLNPTVFACEHKEATGVIDKDLCNLALRRAGSCLSLTDRASEKVTIVKDGKIYFNTGVFVASITTPFSGEEVFLMSKQVADIVATLSEVSESPVKYSIYGDKIVLLGDSQLYVEAQVSDEKKVAEFLSPAVGVALGFNANVSILNDNLLRIISVVKSMEYLSNIVNVSFSKQEMCLSISTQNKQKTSQYKFAILEGAPSVEGATNLTVEVFQLFLSVVGSDVFYDFTDQGIGIMTKHGKFLIRKS